MGHLTPSWVTSHFLRLQPDRWNLAGVERGVRSSPSSVTLASLAPTFHPTMSLRTELGSESRGMGNSQLQWRHGHVRVPDSNKDWREQENR